MDLKNYEQSTDLAEFETPFADDAFAVKEAVKPIIDIPSERYMLPDLESPFADTFDNNPITKKTPLSGEYNDLLAEIQDNEFNDSLYEMAYELETLLSSKVNDIHAMGENFIPYAKQQSDEYFTPLINEIYKGLDSLSSHFTDNNLSDYSEADIEGFFINFETINPALSPAQDYFFKKIFKKVKNVVKKGVKLVKKILPVDKILKKLKDLIKPLLKKVLDFAIDKLPQNLRPYAHKLAKQFLHLEVPNYEYTGIEKEQSTGGDLASIGYQFDNYISNLLLVQNEAEQDALVHEYINGGEYFDSQNGDSDGTISAAEFEKARERFIYELKNLQEGESPQQAIENFLPVAMIKPAIKLALKVIGRKKVVDFLAKLLAKLIGRFIPKDISMTLSKSIVDVGLKVFGFETPQNDNTTIAYEAIANTLVKTIQNLDPFNNEEFNNTEYFTANVLNAFEHAAADYFPQEYIKPELRKSAINGVWVLQPQSTTRKYYKKFTEVFDITLYPHITNNVATFGGLSLSSFLTDRMSMDPSKPIRAKVHLYEAIPGTWLSRINKYENIPGLRNQRQGWEQLHPLTPSAANLLFNEPFLGKDFPLRYLQNRNNIAVGQRFFYLQIDGAQFRNSVSIPSAASANNAVPVMGSDTRAWSSDVQAVLNFRRSEIKLNCFFNESDAQRIVSRLNQNDYAGATATIVHSVRNILHNILIRNISNKVKIIHESFPELYLSNYEPEEENFAPLAAIGAIASTVGKELLVKLVEKIIDAIVNIAKTAIVNYFKARAAEFKQAQQQSPNGVTVSLSFINIPGMSKISAVINALRGDLSLGNITDMVLPSFPVPEVTIQAGKHFD